MKQMVALIGEQALPNLLPAYFLKPQEILLVYSQFTEATFQRLEPLLIDKQIGVHGLKCQEEYEIVSVAKQLETELSRLGFANEMGFNLTGGTKAMVLAAYTCARRRESEMLYLESGRGVSRLYRYQFSPEDDLLLIGQEEIPPILTIEQFLDAHLGKDLWQEKGYSKDIGGDFERAIGETLDGVVDFKAGIHFLGDERGRREQADLDLVIRVGNQFGVIEAKDQKNAKIDALKQLHYLSRLLGTYTSKLWASSRAASADHQAVIEATRTTMIELPSFASGSLSEADKAHLRERVLQSFK